MDVGSSGGGFFCEGKGVSSGRATGSAKLVSIETETSERYPSEGEIIGLEQVSSGDIMITPAFYPSMTSSAKRSCGLVVYDEYVATSRGSVTGREIGIPAVIACSEALMTMDFGERVTIDGRTGEMFCDGSQHANNEGGAPCRTFPRYLPNQPPNREECQQLFEVWRNVINITEMTWRKIDELDELKEMVVTTENNKEFQVIWKEERERWFIKER
jgi:phosphohistidine swiveling domain-containing protein